jgi:hypothetical protein
MTDIRPPLHHGSSSPLSANDSTHESLAIPSTPSLSEAGSSSHETESERLEMRMAVEGEEDERADEASALSEEEDDEEEEEEEEEEETGPPIPQPSHL